MSSAAIRSDSGMSGKIARNSARALAGDDCALSDTASAIERAKSDSEHPVTAFGASVMLPSGRVSSIVQMVRASELLMRWELRWMGEYPTSRGLRGSAAMQKKSPPALEPAGGR